MILLAIIAIIVIFIFAYGKELGARFGSLDNEAKFVLSAIFIIVLIVGGLTGLGFWLSSKQDSEKQIVKEVVVTVVSSKQEDKVTYIKLSDGHVVQIKKNNSCGYEDYEKWCMVKEGDKVRKLIRKDDEKIYTPEFEDNIAN